MTQPRAWLIDVWDTLLSVDFDAVVAKVADVAGVPHNELRAAVESYTDPVMVGEMSSAEAFVRAAATVGDEPSEVLATKIKAAHWGFALSRTTVFADAVSFMQRARQRGELVALVSNCGDQTRPLLRAHGLLEQVDLAVLSCEIGIGKPDRGIFDYTIATLGIDPSAGTLVDDQLTFCQGAVAAGLQAIHLVRDGDGQQRPVQRIATAQSFDDIA
jgi:FMN phosphatase YigB (HAD superfamily)